MFTIGQSSKLFTIWLTLLALKLNFLLSDTALIKQPISKTYLTLLLSWIPSIQQKRSSTLSPTCSKSRQLSFLTISESSSIAIIRTQSNSGSALVKVIRSFIKTSTSKLSLSILFLSPQIKIPGISVKNQNETTLSINGRWCFKY